MEPQHLRPRPYRAPRAGDPGDLRAVLELLLSAQAAEPGFDWPGAGQLRALLADPELDLARDTCLWEDMRGKLIAFALRWGEDHLLWFTRPSAQSDGLDALIVAWAVLRARQVAAPGATITLRTEARGVEAHRVASLERLGFVAQPGGSLRLSRSLASTPLSDAPAGYRIRSLVAHEVDAWLALARGLFPHAKRPALTEARRRALMGDSSYMPGLDLVAVAADGSIVGFCHAALRPEERERLGRRSGWIELLGVAPEHRCGGLARALLRAGLLALADYGADCALLTMRADNSAAHALYAAEGFTALYEERAYTLTLAS